MRGGRSAEEGPDVGRRAALTRARTTPVSVQSVLEIEAAPRGAGERTHYSGFMAAAAALGRSQSKLCSASRSKMVAAPPQRPRPRRAGANVPDWGLDALLLGTCSPRTFSNSLPPRRRRPEARICNRLHRRALPSGSL